MLWFNGFLEALNCSIQSTFHKSIYRQTYNFILSTGIFFSLNQSTFLKGIYQQTDSFVCGHSYFFVKTLGIILGQRFLTCNRVIAWKFYILWGSIGVSKKIRNRSYFTGGKLVHSAPDPLNIKVWCPYRICSYAFFYNSTFSILENNEILKVS